MGDNNGAGNWLMDLGGSCFCVLPSAGFPFARRSHLAAAVMPAVKDALLIVLTAANSAQHRVVLTARLADEMDDAASEVHGVTVVQHLRDEADYLTRSLLRSTQEIDLIVVVVRHGETKVSF